MLPTNFITDKLSHNTICLYYNIVQSLYKKSIIEMRKLGSLIVKKLYIERMGFYCLYKRKRKMGIARINLNH